MTTQGQFEILYVADLDETLTLDVDSESVKEINYYFAQDFDGYFLSTENGEYASVFGFYGTPYLNKQVYEVTL